MRLESWRDLELVAIMFMVSDNETVIQKKLYEAYFISDIHIKKQNKKQIPLYLPTEIKDLQPFAKVSSL